MNQHSANLFDRYKIVKTLEGGMGIVHLCLDEQNDNFPLALKTYKSPQIANNKIKESFLREISLWVEIGVHPNIVKAYSVEMLPDTQEIFLSMELIPTFPGKENASLRSWLTKLPLSFEWLLGISNGIIQGMLFATEKMQGLVHRDLKPENILIGINQEAKITDFGLARLTTEVKTNIEGSGNDLGKFTDNTAGTPLYKSPEQWNNTKIDCRTDIYAFGCIMAEMLTGDFVVYGDSLEELKYNHVNGMAIKRANNSNFPKPLLIFLQKCLHPESQKRFSTWKEVNEEFNNMCEELIKKRYSQPEALIDIGVAGQIAKGSSFIAIAQAYLTINDSENAYKYFYKAFDIGKIQRHPILLSIATSGLGIVLFNQGNYEKAINYYQTASEINLGLMGDAIFANNRINICNIYFIRGEFESAKKYAMEAISIAEKISDFESQVQYIYTLANILSASGNYTNALEQYEVALHIINNNQNHVLIGGIQLGIGTTYFQLRQFDYAFRFFQDSLRYSITKGNNGLKANSLIGITKTLISQNKNNEAWVFLDEAKKTLENISEKHQIVQLKSDIGALLSALAKPEDAISYLSHAVKLARELKLQSIEARSLFSLGMAYELTFDMPNAIKNLKKSVELLRALNMPEHDVVNHHLNDLINALQG